MDHPPGLSGDPGIKITMIKRPGEKLLICEEQSPNDGNCDMGQTSHGDDLPTDRHNGRANFGFADGHVESLLPTDFGYDRTGKNVVDTVALAKYFDLFN